MKDRKSAEVSKLSVVKPRFSIVYDIDFDQFRLQYRPPRMSVFTQPSKTVDFLNIKVKPLLALSIW